MYVIGEYGSVVSGQLTNIRAAVVVGSQPVSIKMLTGIYACMYTQNVACTCNLECPCVYNYVDTYKVPIGYRPGIQIHK